MDTLSSVPPKAHYEFIKRYGVPGTQAPTSACDFKFNSGADGSGSDGTFHSPRHPARYPSGLDCVYHFLKAPGERVFIAFSAFAGRNLLGNDLVRGYRRLYSL